MQTHYPSPSPPVLLSCYRPLSADRCLNSLDKAAHSLIHKAGDVAELRDMTNEGPHFSVGGDEEDQTSDESSIWSESGLPAASRDGHSRGEAETQVEHIIPGSVAEIRNLYREDPDHSWDEWMPDDIPREINEAWSKYAVVVRFQPRRKSRQLVLHSVTVHSELLRKVLHRVFEDYEGISTRLKDLTFRAPLQWHIFERLHIEEKGGDSEKHMNLLYSVIGKEIKPHILQMQDFTVNGVVSFEYLWAIFPPGHEVYSRVDDQNRLYRTRSCKYLTEMTGEPFFSIYCEYVDCDGKSFGYVSTSLKIDYFSGVKKIPSLSVFPAHLHPETESLLEMLNHRGEYFERLNGFNHVAYSRFYIDRYQGSHRSRYTAKTRIIIDPETYAFYDDRRSQKLGHLDRDREHAEASESDGDLLGGLTNIVQEFLKFEESMDRHERQRNKNFSDQTLTLTVKQRVLTNPMVRGFCLSSKTWCEFYIDNIQPISWNEDAFQRLVLPKDYKDIIHAFVQEQLSGDDSFDDIVEGKDDLDDLHG
ncbi:hypothetical protein NPX13_g3364 [Xylaria arbuscula]|uniref:DUF7025 domain-containing protein n=1 Tax=Xylaria arbuscula TaxID=114810 RepID=A0A9W8NID5_9PEZI|nr:hypothetical protein NPX13_g3364 [Xylaria arbuscula]